MFPVTTKDESMICWDIESDVLSILKSILDEDNDVFSDIKFMWKTEVSQNNLSIGQVINPAFD
jgi:hypothetical protein